MQQDHIIPSNAQRLSKLFFRSLFWPLAVQQPRDPVGLYHRHKENQCSALTALVYWDKTRFSGASTRFAFCNRVESGSEEASLLCGGTSQRVIGVCHFGVQLLQRPVDRHHDYRPLQRVAPFQKDPAAVSRESRLRVDFSLTYHCFCHLTLCLCSFERWDLLAGPRALLSLKVPPPPAASRKYIISGDKHRKPDMLSCCAAIFLPLSFHHKSKLRQPLCSCTTKSAIGRHQRGNRQEADSPFSPPGFSKITSSSLFFSSNKNPCSWTSTVPKKLWLWTNTHIADALIYNPAQVFPPNRGS